MLCPQAKLIYVPIIKNGPKGTSDFIFFFLKAISNTPIKAPKKKEIKRPGIINGQPKNNPNKNILIIVNTIKLSQELYKELYKYKDEREFIYLSTSIIPKGAFSESV